MLLAMARDVRVILIKLADRLHNMRTLDAVPPEKQERIARETLDIYAPIANRLGLNALYYELQDLALPHLHPDALPRAREGAQDGARQPARRGGQDRWTRSSERLARTSRSPAQVTGREKHISSIYKKMQEKNISFSEVFDIYGFRIIVPTCRAATSRSARCTTLYKPIPGKFKDYIAIPKANGYQSLHTTLFGPFGMPIEIQIRTAGHAQGRRGGRRLALDVQERRAARPRTCSCKTHQWLQSLLEIQSESGDALEFLEHIKVDLFPDEVYVFTPKGKIFALPRGATADRLRLRACTPTSATTASPRKVNGELVPLRHRAAQRRPRRDRDRPARARPNPVVALVRRAPARRARTSAIT